jgi:hypothetical protein
MEEKQYKIYRLILDGETVYVGQTTQSLKRRKSQHHFANIFERIIESEIELIEITIDKSREHFWIDYYLNQGCILLNKRRGATGLNYEEYRKSEEYKEYQKHYKKKWQKKYKENNKDEINRKQREYRAKKKLEKENNINN